ncbi:MAG TPA: hypothetical protein VF896_08225 [Anaerolineales bacterium]
MKTRLLSSLSLIAVLLAACAPTETQTQAPELASATHVYIDSLNSATPAPTIQAVATSRGPNLEATDPNTVSMASGGLQFVEFFEFW